MEPISNYYYDGTCYVRKSPWPKRIRLVVSAVFVAFATVYMENSSFAQYEDEVSEKIRYEDYIQDSNPNVKGHEAREIALSVIRWGNEFKIDEKLLLAISKVESNFHKHAISPSGAYGLMQVIPVWHKSKVLEAKQRLGNPELFNINTNIYLGARILRDCFTMTPSVNKALLCYAGQTPGYDHKVLQEYRQIKKL